MGEGTNHTIPTGGTPLKRTLAAAAAIAVSVILTLTGCAFGPSTTVNEDTLKTQLAELPGVTSVVLNPVTETKVTTFSVVLTLESDEPEIVGAALTEALHLVSKDADGFGTYTFHASTPRGLIRLDEAAKHVVADIPMRVAGPILEVQGADLDALVE